MEFKGTKEKWNIHEDNEIGILIGGYNPISDVCTVHRYGDKTEENANAKLIASAPRMIKTLIRTYLKLQVLSNKNVSNAIETDLTRADLRNTICEALGVKDQELQEYIEQEALKLKQ